MSSATSLYQTLSLTPTVFLIHDKEAITSYENLFKSTGLPIIFAQEEAYIDSNLKDTPSGLLIWSETDLASQASDFYNKIKDQYPDYWQILLSNSPEDSWIQRALEEGGLYACYLNTQSKQYIFHAIQHAIQAKSLEDSYWAMTERLKHLQESYDSAINIFSSIIDIKTFQPEGHARRVSDHAQAVALGMGCDTETVKDVSYAGLLHDLGRLTLPGEIINKPFEKLTPDEKKILKKYPTISEFALMALNPLEGAARIIRSHQEYVDGTGYPDGIQEKDIPIGSQILAVVSDYYQLQEGKIFDEKLSREDAIDFLVANTGKRYNKKIVDIFCQILECEHQAELKIQRSMMVSDKLEPGMTLDRDLMSIGGMLLLPKGHHLNSENIRSIIRYEKDNDFEFRIYIKPR